MANNFNHYSDKKERRLILKSFACVGFSTTGLMGLVAGFNHEYVLFLSLVISSSLFLSAWFLHKKEMLSASIISYTLYVLMLYLVLTGGADGTGPVWIFIVPPVTFLWYANSYNLAIIWIFRVLSKWRFFSCNTLSTILLTSTKISVSSSIDALFCGGMNSCNSGNISTTKQSNATTLPSWSTIIVWHYDKNRLY